MENQHRAILGYRELNEKEIELMNKIKSEGRHLLQLIELLDAEGANERWVEIGVTHLQQGLMALTRAVAKPDFF